MLSAANPPSQLDDFIYKTDIYTLLSLENLSQEEKNNFTLSLTRTVITKALEGYISANDVPEENLMEIEKKLKELNDPVASENYLLEVFPDLISYITAVTIDLKKEALLKQIVDVRSSSANITEDFTNITDGLIRSIKTNDFGLFEQSYSAYKLLRQNNTK